jgi:F-type H+-transporting ATPase subunit b
MKREAASARQVACELMHRVGRLAAWSAVALLATPGFARAAQEAEAHEIHLADFFWPVVNFVVLCGVLYYFLRTPLTTYLRDRGTGIRKDLVDAAALKSEATKQLAEIDRKLQALPGELAALRRRGEEEIAAEGARIAQAAEADRARLVEQSRREIDAQVRLAKRALTEHAADLAVGLAAERIKAEMTESDQSRLVSRYIDQVKH